MSVKAFQMAVAVVATCLGVTVFANSALSQVIPNVRTRGASQRSCLFTNAQSERLRIEPQTSGFTCKQIREAVALLPSETGTWPISANGKVVEVCRIYGPAQRVRIECQQRPGKTRHFDIVLA
jgi:hypothetical protein